MINVRGTSSSGLTSILRRGQLERPSAETMRVVQQSAAKVEQTTGNLNRTINQLRPELVESARNTRQATDTLKRQPWRLIWPSTKRYPEEQRPPRRQRPEERRPGRTK